MVDTAQVVRWSGASSRQVMTWIGKGFLKPDLVPGQGFGGKQYSWTMDEARVAERLASLVKAGLYPDAAHQVARGEAQALSKLLAAVQPCMGAGELRYRLTPWPSGDEEAGE